MSESNIPMITLDSKVCLCALSKQLEDGVAIIGQGDQFLELPPEGLQFIAWLDEGLSLGEARERFEAMYNPLPEEDVMGVMNAFLECDFIAAIDGQTIPRRHAPPQSDTRWIPQKWAQALFSKPVLIAWIVIVVPAFALLIATPAFWSQRSDYFWTEYNFVVVLSALVLWLASMVTHELAHFLACRAKGVDATITWTQRMGFFPMSQTTMHNIWAVPRSARLLPIAAGMAWDVFGMSVALYLLFFHEIGGLTLSLVVINLLKFYLLTSTIALTAQFFLFSRMDGYFLLSALLGQRNLQADTYRWLKSKVSKSVEFDPPAGGMKFIYIYALISLIWGGLFMGQFLTIDLPIKLQLIWESFLKVSNRANLTSVDFADGVAVLTSQLIYWGLLVYAYWRDTLPSRRRA